MAYTQERRDRVVAPSKKPMTRLANVFFVFLIGYLTANFFNFAQLTGWIHRITRSSQQLPASAKVTVKPRVPKPKFEFYTLLEKIEEERLSSAKIRPHLPPPAATPVKPVLPLPLNLANKNTVTQQKGAVDNTTATVLAKNSLAVGETSQVTKATVATTAMNAKNTNVVSGQEKNTYWIQLASFKGQSEAERLKITLTLKGFDVKIKAVASQQGAWFRVLLGPYPSRNIAEKMQLAIAQNEHIQGMVYRI